MGQDGCRACTAGLQTRGDGKVLLASRDGDSVIARDRELLEGLAGALSEAALDGAGLTREASE